MLKVVKSGPGLAFYAYPEVVAQFEVGSNVFSALFFIMLITLATGSIFGLYETALTALCDEFVNLRKYRPHIVLASVLGKYTPKYYF